MTKTPDPVTRETIRVPPASLSDAALLADYRARRMARDRRNAEEMKRHPAPPKGKPS